MENLQFMSRKFQILSVLYADHIFGSSEQCFIRNNCATLGSSSEYAQNIVDVRSANAEATREPRGGASAFGRAPTWWR